MKLAGVIPILATPFHEDESIDHESLGRMIRFFAGLGVNGVTVLGVLGESNRLTDSERAALILTAVKAANGLPVIAGCSHSGTKATVALALEAKNLGAAAVMIAPSKQPVPSDDAVFAYYRQVAEGAGAPIVLQDHPASTEVHMRVDLILRMAKEIPDIACIKAEATPSPAKISALRKGLGSNLPIPILTGLGGLYGFFDLDMGSDGFNTGFAFPEVLIAMTGGDNDRAYDVYRRYLPLMVFEQQPGLAIRKEILRRRGLLSTGRVRHPGGNLDRAAAAQLESLLARTFPGQDITRRVEIA